MFTNIKAAIFDLDGTLINSMSLWDQIDVDYLTSKNIPVPSDLNDEISHLSFNQVAVYFKERFKLEDSLDDIKNTWNTMAYNHYSSDITLKDGVIEFLNFLKKSNIKIGLATSNSTELLEASLKFNKIYDYFDAITITDEVSIGKHEPDVYLLAAKKLNVKPEECIVFEDILPAIKGAKKAGMKVIAVEDECSVLDKDEIIKNSDGFINDFKVLIPQDDIAI
ncbi:HAD family hydrolase [Clostridium baratii]|uniref:Haloacid dehalogenase, IA family protein n=1 Tax=Clostridium baratii TaxID=1561 RepID=A0A174T8H9_9CLOT|nr:HAD family phosphatase [Clostridium baratii]OPF51067.1 HAD family hydrolase [Clostridium baratii]OPF53980.1 HAD family hydrolase [Clostridium baratii]OPF57942.1 HAD family hydrolase [Clostridium baratii]OPF61431.1 HAD family hydrolase [Clostridium baratii]CUQ04005.1 haloacid dehalogenase%2C IA family protein [Clostridium baratii]